MEPFVRALLRLRSLECERGAAALEPLLGEDMRALLSTADEIYSARAAGWVLVLVATQLGLASRTQPVLSTITIGEGQATGMIALEDVPEYAVDVNDESQRLTMMCHTLQLANERSASSTRKVSAGRRLGEVLATWGARTRFSGRESDAPEQEPLTVILVLDTAFTRSASAELVALAAAGGVRVQMFGTQELPVMLGTGCVPPRVSVRVPAGDEAGLATLMAALRATAVTQLKGILATDPLCRLLGCALGDVLEIWVPHANQGAMQEFRVVREPVAVKVQKQPRSRRVNTFAMAAAAFT